MRTRSVVLLLVLLAAVSLVLGAWLAILFWSISDGAGIGAGYLAIWSLALVAAAGAVAAVVLAITLRRRTRGRVWPWALAGVVAWVVGPVYVGGAIGGTVDDYLDAKYSSPAFAAEYAARLGVAITPQGQGFAYNGCTMQTFSAAYRITAARDTDLIFGLTDNGEIGTTDAGYLARQSIATQFERVGDGYVWRDAALGIFRVPAGTHTFTVNATAPFLLTVNATEPLWTPRYALHASWRSLRLYADDYTLAQIYAAAAPFHPASCPKICTRADIPMAEAADGAALETLGTIARIGPIGGEQLVDTGGDELYDVIRLSVPLVITRTGDYALAGELVDTTGRTLASDSYESPYAEPLCTGVHTISFTFGAQSIRGFAADGPYTLTALTLEYVDPTTFEHRPIEKIDNAYSTRAYSWTLFEGGGSAPTAREDRDFSDQRTTPPSLR